MENNYQILYAIINKTCAKNMNRNCAMRLCRIISGPFNINMTYGYFGFSKLKK